MTFRSDQIRSIAQSCPALCNPMNRSTPGLPVHHQLPESTLSRPNFTVYDEILGGVAVSNYENVRELFNRMAKSYDFILHITHNEMISDWHNETITVTKDKDGVSVIETK